MKKDKTPNPLTGETSDEVIETKRRDFLKKVAYKTPVIIAMGALSRPTQSRADFGPPPSGPTFP